METSGVINILVAIVAAIIIAVLTSKGIIKRWKEIAENRRRKNNTQGKYGKVKDNKDSLRGNKIFINYRKEDSSGYSLALYHELIKWYDKNNIFKDFNAIDPGEDFQEAIEDALSSCNILLVLINNKWLEILKQRDSNNREQDFVRLEIATALSKNIYTIPITINGSSMPSEDELPIELKKLTRRQFLDIDQTRFETDVLKLISIIDKRMGIKRDQVDR